MAICALNLDQLKENGSNRILKLHGVQLPPLPLFPSVHLIGLARAVFPSPFLVDTDFQLHPLVPQIQLHTPRFFLRRTQ